MAENLRVSSSLIFKGPYGFIGIFIGATLLNKWLIQIGSDSS